MKALYVNETNSFKRGKNPIEIMDLGLSNRLRELCTKWGYDMDDPYDFHLMFKNICRANLDDSTKLIHNIFQSSYANILKGPGLETIEKIRLWNSDTYWSECVYSLINKGGIDNSIIDFFLEMMIEYENNYYGLIEKSKNETFTFDRDKKNLLIVYLINRTLKNT